MPKKIPILKVPMASSRLSARTDKIFLNTNSELDDVSKELQAFLDYVAGKDSEDSFIKKLQAAVKEAKKNREWRHEFMTLLMRDQENIEKGREEGRKEGITAMIENALESTKNIKQTSLILKIDEEQVRKIANDMGIHVND